MLDIPIAYLKLEESINYGTLDEMLAMRNRRWPNYLVFRFAPPAISIMLGIGIAQSLGQVGLVSNLVLGGTCWMVSSIPHWKALVGARGYLSVQLIHLGMILLAALIVLGVALLGGSIDFRWIVPSIEGLRDDAWTALVIAIALAVFWQVTNIGSPRRYPENSNALDEFVRNHAATIERRFGETVYQVAERHGIPRRVLIAILVYEDLNRQKWIRLVENLVVLILPLSLTVGIAQVRSNRPLSDAESIEKMGPIVAQLLAAAECANYYRPEFYVFREYNGSTKYAQNVQRIYDLIATSW